MGSASIPPSPFLHPCILVHLHLHIPWSFCRLAPLSSYPLPFFFPFVSFFALLSNSHSLPFPVALPSPAPQPSPPPRPRPRIPLCPSSAPFPIIRLFARHSVAFPCLGCRSEGHCFLKILDNGRCSPPRPRPRPSPGLARARAQGPRHRHWPRALGPGPAPSPGARAPGPGPPGPGQIWTWLLAPRGLDCSRHLEVREDTGARQ